MVRSKYTWMVVHLESSRQMEEETRLVLATQYFLAVVLLIIIIIIIIIITFGARNTKETEVYVCQRITEFKDCGKK